MRPPKSTGSTNGLPAQTVAVVVSVLAVVVGAAARVAHIKSAHAAREAARRGCILMPERDFSSTKSSIVAQRIAFQHMLARHKKVCFVSWRVLVIVCIGLCLF